MAWPTRSCALSSVVINESVCMTYVSVLSFSVLGQVLGFCKAPQDNSDSNRH